MKPRHAAALALVGWYLMMPPEGSKDTLPLSKWKILNSFEQVAECQRSRKEFNDSGFDLAAKHPKNEFALNEGYSFMAAVCIETDDPRLAK